VIDGLAYVLFDLVVPFFAGITPERPLWFRRLVQACWLVLALVFVAGAVYGLYGLVGALTS